MCAAALDDIEIVFVCGNFNLKPVLEKNVDTHIFEIWDK